MRGQFDTRLLPLLLLTLGFSALLTIANPLPRGDYWNFLQFAHPPVLYWWGAHTGQHHSEFVSLVRLFNFFVTGGDARGLLFVMLGIQAVCLGLLLSHFVPHIGRLAQGLVALGLCLPFFCPGQVGVWAYPFTGIEWWSVHGFFLGALFVLTRSTRTRGHLLGALALANAGLFCFTPAYFWAAALGGVWIVAAHHPRREKWAFAVGLTVSVALHLLWFQNPASKVPPLSEVDFLQFPPYLSGLVLFPFHVGGPAWLLLPLTAVGLGLWKGTEKERLWIGTLILAVLMLAFGCLWYRGIATPAFRYYSVLTLFWVCVVLAGNVAGRGLWAGNRKGLAVGGGLSLVVLFAVSAFSWQRRVERVQARFGLENFPYVMASMALEKLTPRYKQVVTSRAVDSRLGFLKEMGHFPFVSRLFGEGNALRLSSLPPLTLTEWAVVSPFLAEFCVATPHPWPRTVQVGARAAVLLRTKPGVYCGVADVRELDVGPLFGADTRVALQSRGS